MMTIEEMVQKNILNGMSINQAQNYVCQEIILNKISQSEFADNVLIKGGVVMFNMTHSLRRATSDLDFDFIRYDISDESISRFVTLLNKYDSNYKVKLVDISPLHHEDYQGKRVWVLISDRSYKIRFKLDIGVHTLFAIKQEKLCFYFDDNQIMLKVNPPEQIFAEKIYSLAKHGALSTRFKDIFDMYYFVDGDVLDGSKVKICLEAIVSKQNTSIKTLNEIIERVKNTFNNRLFIENFKSTDDKWIDIDYEQALSNILDYLATVLGVLSQ